MRYFLMRPDLSLTGVWSLGDVRNVNNWILIQPPPQYMEPGRHVLDIYVNGVETDYSLAGYAGVPILSETAVRALDGLPEADTPYVGVVFNPVEIVGQNVSCAYYAMIIEDLVDCVDEHRSEFEKFAVGDSIRPDLAGRYSYFLNLVIDSSRAGERNIFRIYNYPGAIVVSEVFKKRFERSGVSGVLFSSVDGDVRTVA